MIRIGTRKSELAQWQAKLVQSKLHELGRKSELVLVDSYGDVNLKQPLYELGVVGVFTKSLDIALLNNEIDIAVHSMKDVPVGLPEGIIEYAVLERGDVQDVLVTHKEGTKVIASSSLRRRAQWLSRYPEYTMEDLRGNVNTRMQKVSVSNWEGAIFAKVGLERIGLLPASHVDLDWMIPAPAQGALMITGRKGEESLYKIVNSLSDQSTVICVKLEREILRLLEGGCTAPIGVHANISEDVLKVKAGVFALDGSAKSVFEGAFSEFEKIELVALEIVEELRAFGAQEILNEIKK
ncbi:MAG: hydroxymethylbilane synthase [Flavobacteriales bacterium]|nr:hydroxymethylbilane synthase [Flavobacteriales bacterium]